MGTTTFEVQQGAREGKRRGDSEVKVGVLASLALKILHSISLRVLTHWDWPDLYIIDDWLNLWMTLDWL